MTGLQGGVPVPVLRARARWVTNRLPTLGSTGRSVAQNSGWLMAERVLRMVVAFLITTWIVRYLGPIEFGVLAYGLSLILIIDSVATLGLRSIIVRDLVEQPEREPEIIGTAIGLRLLGSVVAGGLVLLFVAQTEATAKPVAVVGILALGLPLNALAAMDLSFQATMRSRLAVLARITALGVASLFRLVMLLMGAPLLAFAAASALELALVGVAFAMVYRAWVGPLLRLRMRWSTARQLLAVSWPLFISAVAATVYFKIDQVMLQHLGEPGDVGIYAAAARLSEIWYFVPFALASSLMPVLVSRRTQDAAAYRRMLRWVFNIVAWFAIALAAGTFLIATPLIGLLYGEPYAESAGILRIHMWAGPFIFMGTVLGRVLVVEDNRFFEVSRHLAGAVLNVGLNLVLIPRLGGTGAALTTVIAYATASYIVCAITPRTRPHFRLMTEALFPLLQLRAGPRAHAPREER